jgi:cob(I)alamin adenosyltransferase
MKIATKSGDKGKTGRLFGTREPKYTAIMNAVGDVDELNAALGLLKAELVKYPSYRKFIAEIQHKLTLFMGEIAAEAEKRAEYVEKYDHIKDSDLETLDTTVDELQDKPELDQQGWVLYGDTKLGALADFAAKVCRRAERAFLYAMSSEEAEARPVLLKYINRLSDFLHLLARYFDYYTK